MRARVLTALLAGVVVIAAALALRPQAGSGRTLAEDTAASGASHRTPVLSPRRVPALVARVVADGRLTGALDAILADPNLGPARQHACLTVSGDNGRALFTRGGNQPLIPASNLKLLTGLAAIDRLGPAARLRTEVRAAVGPGGVVAGDLWLVGGGDPLLETADYAASFDRQPQLFTPVEELARRVAAAGVKTVQGRVVGDESRYDQLRYLPTWKPRYIADNEIGPESALSVNDNFSQWRPRKFPAAAPAVNAASVFTDQLRAHGVTVVGVPAAGAAPARAPVVASIESPPLSEVVGEMLRESDNLTAELLLKELGHREGGSGTTARGAAVLKSVLGAHRLPTAGLAAVDGSGLDRSDRATCDLILAALQRTGTAGALAAGLAVAGRTGTLEKRFNDPAVAGRLRAKTGSLDGVSALSGFAQGRGVTLTFAFVLNDLPRDALGPAAWEALGRALVAYPNAPDPKDISP